MDRSGTMPAAEINPGWVNAKNQQETWRMKNMTLTSKKRAKYWERESPRHREQTAVQSYHLPRGYLPVCSHQWPGFVTPLQVQAFSAPESSITGPVLPVDGQAKIRSPGHSYTGVNTESNF